mgnify:CR=1 FL=1
MNEKILVELLLAFPEEAFVQNIHVTKGTTVGDIKKRKDLLPVFLNALDKSKSIAINGKNVGDDRQILQHERLVFLRHLIMDPKEMRRRRSNKL